jgi:hypothetical protein
MAGEIPLINTALTRTGNGRITSFEDGSAEANVAEANYETTVAGLLSIHPWLFAKANARPDKLADDPLADGSAAFQVPNASIKVLNVQSGDVPVPYTIFSDKILTHHDHDKVVVTYIWRVPEVDWPGYFRELVVTKLEALFLRALNDDDVRAERRENRLYDRDLPRARSADAQQNYPRPRMESQLLDARTGTSRLARR